MFFITTHYFLAFNKETFSIELWFYRDIGDYDFLFSFPAKPIIQEEEEQQEQINF